MCGSLEVKNLYLGTSLGAVICWARLPAMAITRACVQHPVISIEDLIRAKESLARPKDLLAAQELRAILEQNK